MYHKIQEENYTSCRNCLGKSNQELLDLKMIIHVREICLERDFKTLSVIFYVNFSCDIFHDKIFDSNILKQIIIWS